jgi:competence protein ComGC
MRFNKKHKTGFSLIEIIVLLLLISVIMAATIPMLTKRKSDVGTSQSVINCITSGVPDILFNESTGVITSFPDSGNCRAAYYGCQTGKTDICNTLYYYADGKGSSDQITSALKILRASCDQGGEDACEYLIDRCKSNSSNCTSPDVKYSLRFYTNMPGTTENDGRSIIETNGANYYIWGEGNFTAEIDTVCGAHAESTACIIQ